MKKQAGFSLIELMIAIVIIGIVTAIAIPSYNSFTLKSHRSEAKSALLDIAAREEEFYSENKEFTDEVANLGMSEYGQSYLSKTSSGYYKLYVASGSGTSWSSSAIPLESQVNDGLCFKITSEGDKYTIPYTSGSCDESSKTSGWD